jgi:hypothetical protein
LCLLARLLKAQKHSATNIELFWPLALIDKGKTAIKIYNKKQQPKKLTKLMLQAS